MNGMQLPHGPAMGLMLDAAYETTTHALGAHDRLLLFTDGLAEAPRADSATCVVLPLETARMIPRVRPNAIGIARGTAIRAARLLLLRRRHADRCPLSIQSTSMDVRCAAPDASP